MKYLPIALLLMSGILHAVALPLRAAMDGGIEWQDWLAPGGDGLYHTPGSRGWGVLTVQGLARRILVNAVAGVAVVSLLALFEEVGWRAWLLPRLIGRIGARRAVIATSIVWAFWHTPFQLSGITHIEGVSTLRLALSMPWGFSLPG